MAILATDDFNRANGADVGTAWDPSTASGQSAMEIFTAMASYSNAGTDALETNNTVTWPDDQYAEVTLGPTHADGVGAGYGPTCRAATGATATFYRLVGNSSGYELTRFVTGTSTNKSSGSGTTFTTGDKIKLQVTGQGAAIVLKMFKNGTQFGGDIADASGGINAGRAGIGYSSTSNGADGIDAWEGGSIVAAGGKLALMVSHNE